MSGLIKKEMVRKGQVVLALSNPNPEIEPAAAMDAAEAIAGFAPPGDIVPNPLDKDLHRTVARAVARTALRQGLNRDDLAGYFD
ncbi:MAG TPA: hypothetical protein VEG35_04870 [Burkholderiales bacterium]|nr:hypothetical protein [Burkholderiales bacterium]